MEAYADQILLIGNQEEFLRQLITWLSAASAFVFVIGGAFIGFSYVNPVRQRVGTLTRGNGRKQSALVKTATSLGPVAAFVLPQDELERNKVMKQLFQAGFRSKTALQIFYFLKTILIITFPLLTVVFGRWFLDVQPKDAMLYAVMASGVGMLLPNFVLHKLTESRKRALSNGFPDALDLLVVCVESGLGLAAAIQRVSEELEVSHPELATELRLVNAEIRAGVAREEALKHLSERTGLEDIRGLVGLLVQTMRFGTGVADALRVYSEEFRDKRMQKAEEIAAKMGTMLIFPLVLFMFPIFFIVAIGPAVIRIIDAFTRV